MSYAAAAAACCPGAATIRSQRRLPAKPRSTGPLKAMIEKGRAFDVAILGVEATDNLIKSGKLSTRTDIARSGIGVAVRKGAAKPDLGTTQAEIAARVSTSREAVLREMKLLEREGYLQHQRDALSSSIYPTWCSGSK